MNKIHILAYCLLMGTSVELYAQNDGPQFTLKSQFLNGKIRSISTITSHLNHKANGQIIEEELNSYKFVYYKNGYVDSTFSRDESKAYILDYHCFWRGDTLVSTLHNQKAWAKTVFNKDHLPIYNKFVRGNDLVEERWFIYDIENKLLEIKTKLNGYDDITNYTYKSNNDNTFIVTASYLPPEEIYKINRLLKKTFKITFYAKRTQRVETKYFYDKSNNLILEEDRTFTVKNNQWTKSSEVKKRQYLYKYDSNKNWVQQTFLKEGRPYQIERRTILYW